MPLPSNLRLNAFKYPLAFIRLIELLFILIALSSVNSWSYKLTFRCPTNSSVPDAVVVPVSTFSLSTVHVKQCFGDTKDAESPLWTTNDDVGGGAGFFYFVHVLALVTVLAAVFAYVVLWTQYKEDRRIPLGDLAATAACFALFFFCTSVWWSSSNGIGHSTGEERVKELLNDEKFWAPGQELPADPLKLETHNGLLTISVLSGWVLVACFAMNCWHVWKEVTPTSPDQPSSLA